MQPGFDELAVLLNRTYSSEDASKILDAMLRIGSRVDPSALQTRTTIDQHKLDVLGANLQRQFGTKVRQSSRTPTAPSDRRFHVFIAHASEDKPFVAPLATQLKQHGLEVWYDDFVLDLGDNLTREIDKGLALSRYGVVVLSPSFFQKSWPMAELNALAASEHGNRKVILPIWHNIDHAGVARYSPLLAGRIAAKSTLGIQAVAQRISSVVLR